MATTFFDLLTPQQQQDVTAAGIDFNGQVGQLVTQNSNTAANLIAKQKAELQTKVSAVLPALSLVQVANLGNYLITLPGINQTASLFQQLTIAQLQQVLTILTT